MSFQFLFDVFSSVTVYRRWCTDTLFVPAQSPLLKCSCKTPGWCLFLMAGYPQLSRLAYILSAAVFALDQIDHSWCVAVASTIGLECSSGIFFMSISLGCSGHLQSRQCVTLFRVVTSGCIRLANCVISLGLCVCCVVCRHALILDLRSLLWQVRWCIF